MISGGNRVSPALGRLRRAVFMKNAYKNNSVRVNISDLSLLLNHVASVERDALRVATMLARRLDPENEEPKVEEAIRILRELERETESYSAIRRDALLRFAKVQDLRNFWVCWEAPAVPQTKTFGISFWRRTKLRYAALQALSELDAISVIASHYESDEGSISFKFIERKPEDWTPYNQNFRKEPWMPTWPGRKKVKRRGKTIV